MLRVMIETEYFRVTLMAEAYDRKKLLRYVIMRASVMMTDEVPRCALSDDIDGLRKTYVMMMSARQQCP